MEGVDKRPGSHGARLVYHFSYQGARSSELPDMRSDILNGPRDFPGVCRPPPSPTPLQIPDNPLFKKCFCGTPFCHKNTYTTLRNERAPPHMVTSKMFQPAQFRDIYYYTPAWGPLEESRGLWGAHYGFILSLGGNGTITMVTVRLPW